MRNKLLLAGLLSMITIASSLIALSPTRALAEPSRRACPNLSCYGQPICRYDEGFICHTEPAGCAGNSFCQID